jgi:hypothetical protein
MWQWWEKEVQGGLCRGDYPEQQPSYGAGVSGSSFDPPYYDAAGELVLHVTATLNDGLADVARVTYNYRIGNSAVRLWTSVTELCDWGQGCNGYPVYVKEPKFTVSDNANDTPYNFLGDVTSSGQNACNGYGWVSVLGDPNSTTRVLQCPEPDREQAWFKYDNLGTIQDDCYATCTWVIAKAATSGDPDTASIVRWYGGDTPWYGLDEWARLSSGRAAFGGPNDAIPGYQPPSGDCGNGVNYFRRWEIGRWSPNPDGRTSDQAGFHGWEGGYGLTDCQNLFRQMGPFGETFSNYFQFEFR